MGADRVIHGHFEHYPLPRRVADRLYLAGESVPPAFGVATSNEQLALRKAE